MKTSQVLLPLLIVTAVQKGMAVTTTFLQNATVIGTATHTTIVDVLTDVPTTTETKATTEIKSETTSMPSTTTPTIPTTTTITSNKTSSIDICRKVVPDEFKEFYTPIFTSDRLVCVSDCDPMSPRYFHCNGGTCHLQAYIGPICLCPDVDLYLYTDNRCGGKISKLGLFIGVGVTIAVLVIITITLGIYLYRINYRMAPRDESYYETVD